MPASHRRDRRPFDRLWPGFVDAMAALLLTIVFLLSAFAATQLPLGRESDRDRTLIELRAQVRELTDLLALETKEAAALEEALAALDAGLAEERDESLRLSARLAESESARRDAQAELGESIDRGRRGLSDERRAKSEALSRIEFLNQQIAALRRQIAALNDALAAEELRHGASKRRVEDLGRRLNLALAQRVRELAKFRSEFFGRLRAALSGRDDVRVSGGSLHLSGGGAFLEGRRRS